MLQELFKCRGDHQKQYRDAKCQWKAPGKKSEEWMFPRRKNQCQWQKNYKGGMPSSKRYFSAWKGLYLLRMKICFAFQMISCTVQYLFSSTVTRCHFENCTPAYLCRYEIMRFVLILQLNSCNLLGTISWVLIDCLLLLVNVTQKKRNQYYLFVHIWLVWCRFTCC